MSIFPSIKTVGSQLGLLLVLLLLASCKTQAQGGKAKPSDYGIKSKKALELFELGMEQAHNRDYQSAILSYEEALKLEPGFADCYFHAAASAYVKRDYEKTGKYAAKAKELMKEPHPKLYLYLAESAFFKEDYATAADNYEEYFALKPPLSSVEFRMLDQHRKSSHFGKANAGRKIVFKPENMGDNVNSIGEEYLPNLTADGQTIFFTSRRPGCTGGYFAERGDFTEDFYYSEMVDGQWQAAKNLGPPVNTEHNEGAASFSPDGQYVYFAACGLKDGYGDCDIYVSKLVGSTWSKPRNLGPIVNSNRWDSQPCISGDGKTLYFSSRREGGLGAEDIWYSTMEKDAWTEPKNLGAPVNTVGAELCPFIHADGKTLYFSSDEHPGYGALDLFLSRYSPTGWLTPMNLGYPLNTSASEGNIFVSTNGDFGYVNSSRDSGLGKSDIYRFELDERIRPSYATFVRGVVSDQVSQKPLDATVTFINVNTGDTIRAVQTNSVSGRYLLSLPLNQDYAAFVDRKGYLYKSSFFSLRNIDPKTTPYFDVNIQLQPLGPEMELVMSSIFYETNKYNLLDESKPELEHMLQFLRLNKTMKVEIGGHTDNVGSDADNLLLSKNRAAEVRKYLVSKGIPEDRITSNGYGESKPITSNDTPEGRALNRRTVCKILSL